jgi:hypothetical protein
LRVNYYLSDHYLVMFPHYLQMIHKIIFCGIWRCIMNM